MRKFVTFILLSAFLFSSVSADLLPDITKNQKIISGENILNVKDFPERTFFQRTFKYWDTLFEIIKKDWNVWCTSGSVGVAIEVWAIKDISLVEDIIKNYNEDKLTSEEVYNLLIWKWALKLSEWGMKAISCSQVVDKNYVWTEIINYLVVTEEMFYLPMNFRLSNNLSDQTKENLKTLTETSYEKFEINLKKLPNDKQKATIETLISRIDTLLEKEKRKSVIFVLSCLKFLASNSK